MVITNIIKTVAKVSRPAISSYIKKATNNGIRKSRVITNKERNDVERMVMAAEQRPTRVSPYIQRKVNNEISSIERSVGLSYPVTRSRPGAYNYVDNSMNPGWKVNLTPLPKPAKFQVDSVLRKVEKDMGVKIYTNRYTNPSRYTAIGAGFTGIGGVSYDQSRKPKKPSKFNFK